MKRLGKEAAPAVREHPEAWTTGRQPYGQEKDTAGRSVEEVRRRILRESLNRYRNELMDDEERMLLLDRIRRIRRQLRLV